MQHRAPLKARRLVFSGVTDIHLIIWYYAVMMLISCLSIPLQHIFPALDTIISLIFILLATIPAFIILLLVIICEYFSSVTFEADEIIIQWFNTPIRRIPISQFKLLCAVGNQGEDMLCLSCYSAEELTTRQEKRLLNSYLDRHSVPLRKRQTSWQNKFAKDYLNHLHRNIISALKEPNVIMFEMHPALQQLVHQAYPFLPYKNYTEVNSCYISRFCEIRKDRAFRFPLHLFNYAAKLYADGIHLSEINKEFFFIPAEQIRTIVRVDVFKRYEKYQPHHIPLLFVTTFSEEELIAHFPTKGYRRNWKATTADRSLQTVIAAYDCVLNWNRKSKNSCIIPFYEENLQILQTLYPHATVNLISEKWLENSPTTTNVQ